MDARREETLYHGTKADLGRGDLIGPGYASNYGKRKKGAYVYLSATLDAAGWGAELAQAKDRAGYTSSSRPDRSKTAQT